MHMCAPVKRSQARRSRRVSACRWATGKHSASGSCEQPRRDRSVSKRRCANTSRPITVTRMQFQSTSVRSRVSAASCSRPAEQERSIGWMLYPDQLLTPHAPAGHAPSVHGQGRAVVLNMVLVPFHYQHLNREACCLLRSGKYVKFLYCDTGCVSCIGRGDQAADCAPSSETSWEPERSR